MASKDKKIQSFIMWLFIIVAVVVAVVLGTFSVKDIRESKKAENVVNDLTELRIALEKYYQVSRHYPELTKDGAKDNLKLLDYIDENGKKISFADIYGHNTMPKTSATESITENNEVFDTKNFDNGTETGGWNYDYANQTGEIHANLKDNAYSQGIKWQEY